MNQVELDAGVSRVPLLEADTRGWVGDLGLRCEHVLEVDPAINDPPLARQRRYCRRDHADRTHRSKHRRSLCGARINPQRIPPTSPFAWRRHRGGSFTSTPRTSPFLTRALWPRARCPRQTTSAAAARTAAGMYFVQGEIGWSGLLRIHWTWSTGLSGTLESAASRGDRLGRDERREDGWEERWSQRGDQAVATKSTSEQTGREGESVIPDRKQGGIQIYSSHEQRRWERSRTDFAGSPQRAGRGDNSRETREPRRVACRPRNRGAGGGASRRCRRRATRGATEGARRRWSRTAASLAP
jgi:hypothetical protein